MTKPADIGADLGEDDLRGGCADSGDIGEIDTSNAVQLTPQIKLRIVALPVIGRSLGAWWHRMLGRAGQSLHQTCRLLIQLRDQLLVVAVSLQRLLQGEQMLWPVVSNQGLRHLVPRALHSTMTELRQCDGIALAREDGIENRLATGSGDVAEYMVELQVHLTERLLHVQNVLRSHLHPTATLPPQGTNGADRLGWPKASPQQPDRVQILDPLAVGYVAFASGHALQIVRV